MDNTILQVPLSKKLRADATRVALDQGFSSLQEAVRVFLKQLADKVTQVEFTSTIKLSKKNEKRYAKIIDDIESGRAKTYEYTGMANYLKFLDADDKTSK